MKPFRGSLATSIFSLTTPAPVGGGMSSLLEEDGWADLWALNVMAPARLSRLVLPGMQERQWGRIVNVSSIWGREHGGGVAYMTTKAALIALTKSTALSYGKDGILVNSVAPGSVAFPTGSWDRFQTQNEAGGSPGFY